MVCEVNEKKWVPLMECLDEFAISTFRRSTQQDSENPIGLIPLDNFMVHKEFDDIVNNKTHSSTETISKPSCRWFVKTEENLLGPLHQLSIFSLIKENILPKDVLVQQEGSKRWQSFDQAFGNIPASTFSPLKPQPLKRVLALRSSRRMEERKKYDSFFQVSNGKKSYIVHGDDISSVAVSFLCLTKIFQNDEFVVCTFKNKWEHSKKVKGKIIKQEYFENCGDQKLPIIKYVVTFEDSINLTELI